MKGTTPAGARSEREAAAWVRDMFGRVAHRYDLANHLLSFNIDRYWRARTVARVRHILTRPEARVLDICCGTGDLVRALQRGRHGETPAMGSDFCHPMLLAARAKLGGGPLFEADALELPLVDAALDLITVAFGFRNLANYDAGLREMRPNPLFGALYGFYSRRLLPAIGGAISGARDAYTYLPESVVKFPAPEELAEMMRAAGFPHVEFERLTGGIVALHLGRV